MLVSDFFERMTLGKRMSPEKITIVVVSIILAIWCVVFAWIDFDRVPAVPEDYKSLYERLEYVQGKPEEFVTQKGTVTINEDTISYTIENEECEMTGVYNRDYELISSSQKDKAISTGYAIMVSVVLFFFVYVGCNVVLYITIFIVELIVVFIIEKIQDLKG